LNGWQRPLSRVSGNDRGLNGASALRYFVERGGLLLTTGNSSILPITLVHDKADSLLVPGLLANGDELAGKAAVVDAPVGSGHVVLFGIRPLCIWESQGSFALALNAIANWGALSSTSTVLFHHRVTAQRARELPLHVNAPTERNGVERSLFWPHRTHLRDCSPIGGTTDERRPSFQLYTVVIGGRRKRSGVRAG
jgi:hypothetical protein